MVYRQHIDVQYETNCAHPDLAIDAAQAMATNDHDDREGRPSRLSFQEAHVKGAPDYTVHLRVVLRHQLGHDPLDAETVFHRSARATTIDAGEALMQPREGRR